MKQYEIVERRNWAREIYIKACTYPLIYDTSPSFVRSLVRVGAEIADETNEYFEYIFSTPEHHLDLFHAAKINVYVPRRLMNGVTVFYSGYYGIIIPIPGTKRDSLFIPFSI